MVLNPASFCCAGRDAPIEPSFAVLFQTGWLISGPSAAVGSRELERGELQVSFKETGDHRYYEAPFETLPNLNSLNASLLCILPIPALVLLVHVNGDINNRLLFKIHFIGIFSIFFYNLFFHSPWWLENYSSWYMSFIHLTALPDIHLFLHFLIVGFQFVRTIDDTMVNIFCMCPLRYT